MRYLIKQLLSNSCRDAANLNMKGMSFWTRNWSPNAANLVVVVVVVVVVVRGRRSSNPKAPSIRIRSP